MRTVTLRWVAMCSAVAFLVLTGLVVADVKPLVRADVAVHDGLRTFALDHPAWLTWMARLTHLGDTAIMVVLYVALVIVCLIRRRRREALFVAVTGVLVWGVSRLIRELLGRPRPADRLWSVDGFGFPSGHATNSAGLATVVVILCWPLLARLGRIALLVSATAYAVTVGLTRVAGGVHWPSDVLGSWLFAAAAVTAIASVALVPHSHGQIRAPQRSGHD